MESYTWGWEHGDTSCDPPEPEKSWIQISDKDGKEIAIIVCRNFEKVLREHPEWIQKKEDSADMIVNALNKQG